jgi:hypothetical protein
MVESKLVELVVAGSNPVGHPIFFFALPRENDIGLSLHNDIDERRVATA